MWQLALGTGLSGGLENFGEDLTTFSEEPTSPPKRRGPKPELSDPQLHTRREELVQVFEGVWGEIGGELRKCKKPEDLMRIFSSLAESYIWRLIDVLCRPSSEVAFASQPSKVRAQLSKVRARLRALIEPSRRAEESRREAQQKLERADWAVTEVRENQPRMLRKLRMLKRERKKRRKEISKTLREYRTLSDEVGRMEARLKALEALFARQELFRFLKSKRYEVTPLALANAAAGLPYMGWRHSMRKNAKVESVAANGNAYQIFKTIRYLASIGNKTAEKALVADFRENIPSLPSRYQTPRRSLAEKWLYLERAVRQAYRTKPHPRDLPFEITKRYFKQISSQLNVDQVLAEQVRLKLPSEVTKKKVN
jgi:hypothetical protein